MQQAIDRDVHRVARLPGEDRIGERVGQAGAEGLARDVFLDVDPAVQGVVDRAVAGAATEIALQRMRQVGLVRLIEGRRGHDHAGGAVAALEGLRVMEGFLDRMKPAIARQALDGRDLAALGAKRRHQTRMERLVVDMDRAGAAVAGVAALLDAEHLEVAQEGAQALAGLRLGRTKMAVHFERDHASSARICSAK